MEDTTGEFKSILISGYAYKGRVNHYYTVEIGKEKLKNEIVPSVTK